ncbi:MAG: CBS domain-containing protein [archaeon]
MVFVVLPSLSDIKIKRKQLNLTQAGLALKAGVSQSLLAKIESGKLEPSYSNAKKIFDFFESVHEKTVLRAGDFMNSSVKKTGVSAKILDAIKLMKKNGISQLPVMDGERIAGTVSENIIVDKMQGKKNLEEFRQMAVSEVMGEALPTVGEDSPFSVISALLEHNQSVLVVKNGKIAGIISKTDLLSSIIKKNGK